MVKLNKGNIKRDRVEKYKGRKKTIKQTLVGRNNKLRKHMKGRDTRLISSNLVTREKNVSRRTYGER